MKVSERWLREFVNPPGNTAELIHQLTMQGLEVEGTEPAGAPLDRVVVGRVLEVVPHPNADRLRVCRVDVGDKDVSIVCGAGNVRPGGLYPTALPGALLPGGLEIKPATLREVASAGMLCSAVELGLADKGEGLLELDGGLDAGLPIGEALDLVDQILDVKVTPNRADCFSMLGIARDLAATTGLPFNEPVVAPAIPHVGQALIGVRVQDPKDAPNFVVRTIRSINPAAVTPIWLRERLRRSGIRSIHPVVDVTNLVMLELGQPLHAYDLDSLSGGLVVRRARSRETLKLLGGAEVVLDGTVLVIADERSAIGIAGIMGGESTSVSERTTNVLLESAFFEPATIAGRARRFGLQTDAATRFERGVDPAHQERAIERATELLLAIAGGEPGPCQVTSGGNVRPPKLVVLRRRRLAEVLGHRIPDEEVHAILQRLGMTVEVHSEGWRVQPPSFRFDIAVEVDVIEEVARVYGYERIPAVPGRQVTRLGVAPAHQVPLERVRLGLVGRGYQEAVTYSFVDDKVDRLLTDDGQSLPLVNPISSDLGVMRRTLWSGLLQAAQYNLARQQSRVRLFECGVRFIPAASDLREEAGVAGIAIGPALPEQWGLPARAVDFFDVKSDLEAILQLTGEATEFSFRPEEQRALHPGRSARILRGDVPVGWVGVLHPSLATTLELPASPVLFEISASVWMSSRPRPLVPLSRFPFVRRDIALVVDRGVPVAGLQSAVAEVAGPALRELVLFDIFAGERIDAGQKSVALGLILQETSRTLTDADVDHIVSRVVERLTTDFNARIRN